MRYFLPTGTVFCACLAFGIPLAVTPVAIHQKLGFGGASAVLASVLPLLAGAWAGARAWRMIERRGARHTAMGGSALCALGALLCVAATWRGSPTAASFALLAAGRLAMGVGASRCLAGVVSWSIAETVRTRVAAIVVRVGNVAFMGLAFGVTAGLALHDCLGFRAAMFGCSTAAVLSVGMMLGTLAWLPRRAKVGTAWRPIVSLPRLRISRSTWLAASASSCFLYIMTGGTAFTETMMLAYGIVLLPWAFLSIVIPVLESLSSLPVPGGSLHFRNRSSHE